MSTQNLLNQSAFKDILLSVIVNEVDSLKDPFFEVVAKLRDDSRAYYLNPKIIRTKIWVDLRQDGKEETLHKILRIAQGFAFRITEEGLDEKLDFCMSNYLMPCGEPGSDGEDFVDQDFRSKLSTRGLKLPMWLVVLLIAGMFYKSYLFEIRATMGIGSDEGDE